MSKTLKTNWKDKATDAERRVYTYFAGFTWSNEMHDAVRDWHADIAKRQPSLSMSDVDVLRRAVEIADGHGWYETAAAISDLVDILDPPSPPTPEEVLREYDRVMTEAWGDTSGLDNSFYGQAQANLWKMTRAALAVSEGDDR